MLLLVYSLDPLRRGASPRQKNDAIRPHLCHRVNHLLRKRFPSASFVRIGFASPHGQHRVDHEDTAVSPGRQQTPVIWRGFERGVVFLQCDVDVLQGWGCTGRGSHGEAEAVGLIGAVVGILAQDDCLDSVEGGVARPVYGSVSDSARRVMGMEIFVGRTRNIRLAWADTASCHWLLPA